MQQGQQGQRLATGSEGSKGSKGSEGLGSSESERCMGPSLTDPRGTVIRDPVIVIRLPRLLVVAPPICSLLPYSIGGGCESHRVILRLDSRTARRLTGQPLARTMIIPLSDDPYHSRV